MAGITRAAALLVSVRHARRSCMLRRVPQAGHVRRQAGAGAGKRPGVSSGEPAEIGRLAESLSSGSAEGEPKRLPCRWARCT